MAIERVVYSSRGAPGLGERDISGILELAAARNPPAGLSGALCWSGTHFLHLLEGPGEAIDTLLARIARDPRHDEMHILLRLADPHRLFPGLGMVRVDPAALNAAALRDRDAIAGWEYLDAVLDQHARVMAGSPRAAPVPPHPVVTGAPQDRRARRDERRAATSE